MGVAAPLHLARPAPRLSHGPSGFVIVFNQSQTGWAGLHCYYTYPTEFALTCHYCTYDPARKSIAADRARQTGRLCRDRERLARARSDDGTRWLARGGFPGQSDAPSGSVHVQQEVQESQRQRSLPGIIPPVAVPARCHPRLLSGPPVRSQERTHPPQAGLHVDTCGEWPGWPGVDGRPPAIGVRQQPRRRTSWGKSIRTYITEGAKQVILGGSDL